MGFSLIGFAGGIAEGITEKIEKEEKLTSQVLASRIEKAQEAWNRKKKEEAAYEEQLREQLSEMQQLGVGDVNYQKAFLTAPDAFQAYKKAKLDLRLDVTPEQFLTLNKDKLPTGTVEDMISTVKTAKTADAMRQTAQIIPSGGALSMSDESQRRRFEQFAGARGLSLQDVAEAEGYTNVKKLTPAASINFESLQRPEDHQARLKRLETTAINAETQYGPEDERTVSAKNSLQAFRVSIRNMTDDQLDYAKKKNRALSIALDAEASVSPEERRWAENFLKADDERAARLRERGEKDEEVPSTNSLIRIAKTGAANAIRYKYGEKAGRALVFADNPDGSVSYKYTGDDKNLQSEIQAFERQAVVQTLRPYFDTEGKPLNRDVFAALNAFQIGLDDSGKPAVGGYTPPPAPAAPPGQVPAKKPAAAAQPASAASDRVSPQEQAARDKDRVTILLTELKTSVDKGLSDDAEAVRRELRRMKAPIPKELDTPQQQATTPSAAPAPAPAAPAKVGAGRAGQAGREPAQQPVKIPADAPRAKSVSGQDIAFVNGKWIYVNQK